MYFQSPDLQRQVRALGWARPLLLLIIFLVGSPMSDALPQDRGTPLTVDEIRRAGNHLAGEPSLYLQQHAHNPIDWYPWGDEALARAGELDRPIFLSIGYASCHWCHVMEHEVFEDDEVAGFMNENFVCIKVDREERPDLDSVFMGAVQLMTGRGGWPLSVFLTPAQEPFFGGTYIPRGQFLQLVTKIVELHREDRQALEKQAGQVTEHARAQPLAGTPVGDGQTPELIKAAVVRIRQAYDPMQGGFRQQQKFPTPLKWRFLLGEYARNGDPQLAEMITTTCEAMARGGLYDHVGGGFHRYTVDSGWTVPHFEKMLYDNAQLASLYLEAGHLLNRPDFTVMAQDVLAFLITRMRDPGGAFYSSYDADSGGREGSYYIWSPQEITAAVGTEDGPALALLLGVTDTGNFEHTGKSVPTRRAVLESVAAATGRPMADLQDLFARHRKQLARVRDQRIPPGLDRKIVTAWNGLVISALARGFALTGDTAYLKAAQDAADHLLVYHRQGTGHLWRASSDGRPSGDGVLDDYAFLADGLLELYQVSGETDYLAEARALCDLVRREFAHETGGFYLVPTGGATPLGRPVETFDSVEPSGNAVMLHVLLKLAAITGEMAYLEEARQGVDTWSGLLEQAGPEMAWWLNAAGLMDGTFHDVVIAGDPELPATRALTEAYFSLYPGNTVLSLVPAEGADADLLALAPALQGKTASGDKPLAYVCEFGMCRKPTGDPIQLQGQLQSGGIKLRQLR